MMPTIVLGAGGTGGHMFPALATAHSLATSGCRVIFFTDTRGQVFLDKEGAPFESIVLPSAQYAGSIFAKLKALFAITRGVFRCKTLLRQIKPSLVAGFGGYGSFAPVAAAKSLRIPTLLHQSDAIPGKVDSLLFSQVNGITTTFPSSGKSIHTGLPLRPSFTFSPYVEVKDKLSILITGGSQGAQIFGDVVPEALSQLPSDLQSRIHVAHQVRPESLEAVMKAYEKTKVTFEIAPFFDNMNDRYAKAQLFIGRSGASTIMELARCGRPAILVPYPFAAGNHQYYNAQQVVAVGGGWCVVQDEFTAPFLAAKIEEFLRSPKQLSESAVKIRKISIEDAAGQLAKAILTYMNPQIERKTL